MKNILEQLYAGELVPAELKIEGNEEYETLCRKIPGRNRKFYRKAGQRKPERISEHIRHLPGINLS